MGNSRREPAHKLSLTLILLLLLAIPHGWLTKDGLRRQSFPVLTREESFLTSWKTRFAVADRRCRRSASSANAAAQVAAKSNGSAATGGDSGSGESKWSALISPTSLEDEIKRMRLHYDEVVTTPSAFNGGGYQDARRDLSALATLFAIISEHGGEVRWKDQAAAARDLLARTAFNCKAGSTQVYNEARLRKADLQDLCFRQRARPERCRAAKTIGR